MQEEIGSKKNRRKPRTAREKFSGKQNQNSKHKGEMKIDNGNS